MASISPAVLVLLFLILFTILFFIIFGLMQLFQRRRPAQDTAPANSKVVLAAETPHSPSTKFCIKCGTRIPGIADYCPECGNRQ